MSRWWIAAGLALAVLGGAACGKYEGPRSVRRASPPPVEQPADDGEEQEEKTP